MPVRGPKHLLEEGRNARGEGRFRFARSLYRNALKDSRDDADAALKAQLHAELGYLERALHDEGAAERHYRKAGVMFRALGEKLRAAHALRHLADVLREQGRAED